MNKIYSSLAITILLISSFNGAAQKNVQLSFTASPSVNWLSSDKKEVKRNGTVAGFDFGLNADFFLDENEKYAFSTGLQITNSGGRLSYLTNNDFEFAGETFKPGSKIRYRLQYVEIPLAIKLKTSPFQRWTYWGQFGLSSFVNVRARGDSDDGQLDKANINKEVNMFNVAMLVGLGSDFDLGGNNAITMGIIYKNGFLDVTDDNSFGERATLNSIVFKLGLVF